MAEFCGGVRPQPPSYRLAVASHHHMTSRQSKTVDHRPDVTSRLPCNLRSRGTELPTSVGRVAFVANGRQCEEKRRTSGLRRLSTSNMVDRDGRGVTHRPPTARSASCARPPSTAAPALQRRESSYDRAHIRGRSAAAATSRRFSYALHPIAHETSSSAPADCTAYRKACHPAAAGPVPRLSSGVGVRATTVSERTPYHLPSTQRPTVPSSCALDSQASRPRPSPQQGSCLWVGLAKTVDIRPMSATALTATVDNNRERCYACSGVLSPNDTCCLALSHLYHRYCFNCSICKRRMNGRKFYYVNEQVFCENDYVYVGFRLDFDVCVICRDVIRDRELRAMGKSYHVNCFRCVVCRLPLHQQPFTVDIHSRPHCVGDYVRRYAPKCDMCHETIIPSQGSSNVKRFVVADKNYHEHCFRCQDCDTSLTDVTYPHVPSHPYHQPQRSACYPLDGRLLCLQCHLYRVSAAAASSDRADTCCQYPLPRVHGHEVTWPPINPSGGHVTCGSGQRALFVDVTIDGDTSSTCTTSDDVATSDDVMSNPGSDVTESPAPAADEQQPAAADEQRQGGNSVCSTDSGHCSGASDVTVTSSSDTETLDAGSEEERGDDDDDDDNQSGVTSGTLGRSSDATITSHDSLSILDLLADCRATDL